MITGAGQSEGGRARARARAHTHTHTYILQANGVYKTNNSVDIVRWQCTATNKRVLILSDNYRSFTSHRACRQSAEQTVVLQQTNNGK